MGLENGSLKRAAVMVAIAGRVGPRPDWTRKILREGRLMEGWRIGVEFRGLRVYDLQMSARAAGL